MRGYDTDPNIWDDSCSETSKHSFERRPDALASTTRNIVLVMSESKEKREMIRRTWGKDAVLCL